MLSLLDFIKTGRLGAIGCGQAYQEAIDFFGPEVQQQQLGAGTSQLFYNGFEFFYYDDSGLIFAIQHDFIPALQQECPYPISAQISIDTSFLPDCASYQIVRGLLEKHDIRFREIDRDDYMELEVQDGASLDFDQNGLLNGIRYFKF